MRSKRQAEGELMIDHRFSPGVTEAFVRSSGKFGPDDPVVTAGQFYESPAYQCCHCGAGVIVNPKRNRQHDHCAKCDAYTCGGPICSTTCHPIRKQFDALREAALKG